MMINKTQDTISLNNGVDLEVKAASAAGLRGFSCVAVLADEAAHWTTDFSLSECRHRNSKRGETVSGYNWRSAVILLRPRSQGGGF